jgi:hypothetical protein
MTTTNFRVVPLNSEIAEEARRKAHAARLTTRLSKSIRRPAIPAGIACNGCSQGEHGGALSRTPRFRGRPYSESGPIFVHAEACARYPQPTGIRKISEVSACCERMIERRYD